MQYSILNVLKSVIIGATVMCGILSSPTASAQTSFHGTSGGDTICMGDTAKVYAMSTRQSGVSYTWQVVFGDAAGITVNNDTVHLYPNQYTFYRLIGDSAGVRDTVTFGLDIYSQPQINFTLSDTMACVGDSVQLKATSFWPQPFNYRNMSGLLGTGDSIKIAVTANDSVWVEQAYAFNNQCTARKGQKITVDTIPIVTLSSSSDTICSGDSIRFKGNGAATYTYANSSMSLGTGDSLDVSFSANDSVWVVGSDPSGCSSSAGKKVAVKALPIVVLTLSEDTICSGDSIDIYSSGASSYMVSSNNGMIGMMDTLKATFTSNDSVWVVGLDSTTGCSASVGEAVVVNSVSTPVGITTSDTAICVGDTVTIKGVGTGMTFTYLRGTSIIGSGDSTIAIITKKDTLMVSGLDTASGCSSMASISISSKPLPTVAYSVFVEGYVSRDLDVCEGQNFTLKATPGHVKYSWSATTYGQIIGSRTDSFITGQIDTTFGAVYSCEVEGTNGCSTTLSRNIRVSKPPTPGTGITIALLGNAEDTVLCGGESRAANATGGEIYTWSPASALVGGAANVNATNVTLFPAVDATIYLEGINVGCVSKDSLMLRVSQLPTLVFESQTSSVTNPLCEGEPDEFVVTSDADRILWNTVTSKRTTKELAFKETTTFKIIAFNELDCSVEITVTSYVDTTCGVRISTEEFNSDDLSAFYNNDNQTMTISSGSIDGVSNFVVYDLGGNEVLSAEVELESNSKTEIDFSSLESGMYIFKMFNGESQFTRKFLKN